MDLLLFALVAVVAILVLEGALKLLERRVASRPTPEERMVASAIVVQHRRPEREPSKRAA